LLREKERRQRSEATVSPELAWARGYAGRACEFIGEVMGPAWWTNDWLAWRSFVKTIFGEEQTAEELAVFRQCTGLEAPPVGRQRVAWLPVGRRGGKSRIEALVALHLACCYDYTPYLAPGELGHISVLADTRDHASQIMNYAKGALASRPRLRSLVRKELVESIEIEGRVKIEVVTASIEAVRSRTVVGAIFDEIAFWQADETCANPDEEIINAIRPSMITIPNSLQLGASSRYARKGALWNAYRDHYGKSEGPLVWSADTVTMHPSVDQDYIREEYERDPLAAGAEYGLEWRADVAAFVEREVVEAAVMRGTFEAAPRPGVTYKAFCDPAGGSGGDSFTLAIGHSEPDGRGALDALREIRPTFRPDLATSEHAALLKAYKIQVVRGDHYAGDWPADEFRKNGISYEVSELTKSQIYVNWLPLVNSARCSLLDIPRLVAQACGLERRTSRAGRDSIDHAPGGHDDVVNAAAGCLLQVTSHATVIKIGDAAMARAAARRYG
jgi:hypothetical protein